MSGSVDEEVVRMRFDNNAFERGVANTLGLLARLKSSLNFTGADKGLAGIEAKANSTKLEGLSTGIDGVSKKFLALATVGITALTNITNRAVNAGLSFAKSFSVGPILDGLHEYQTNLQSIQTIQANTDQPLTKINASLDELNHYSDQTIYNFSEMARNIGTFTAAGVDLKTATSSIKGIANLAALSGSSSEQASTAMYQLSQAISAGRVGLQDWNSVVNAGMGGKKLQTALATTAQAMGTLDKSAISTTGKMKTLTINGKSFRESITAKPGEKPWLSSEVLVNTLATLDGRFSTTALRAELTATGVRKYTDAQIAAKIATSRTALEQKNGVKYTDAQFKSLQKLSDSSFLAATQVKTFGQAMDVAKETIGSGWSASFKSIFGNFGEARTTFTEMSNAINGFINKNALARNSLLTSWHDMGGRTVLIEGIKNAFSALGSVLKPITQAFREVFPKKTADDLFQLTVRFKNFMEFLKLQPENAAKLKSVFAGLFALFDIGKRIVMEIFHVFTSLFGQVSHGSDGFLTMAAHVGDLIVAFDKALLAGDEIHNIFKIISNVLAIPIHLFGVLAVAVKSFFSGFSFGSATKSIENFGKTGGGTLEHLASVTGHFGDVIDKLKDKVQPAMDKIASAFSGVGKAIGKAFTGPNVNQALKILQTGLLASIALTLKNFFKGGFGLSVETGSGGIFGRIKETLEGVTSSLKAMTLQLKAKALLEIAIAIGILAASLTVLSNIDPKKLQVGLKAMGAAFAELLIAMGLLTKITGSAGFVKIPLMAASLDLLAGAILILTAAVAILGRMSWQELEKGLSAIGILLTALSLAAIPLSANSAGLIRAGVGITAMAIALNILAVAVKAFSLFSWSDMLKGMAGIGIALAGIAIAMRLMPKGMVLQAAALNLIATAVNALYFAVKDFANLSYGDMIKGLLGVAGGLVGIALAMKLMPPTFIADAIGLNLIAIALSKIATAVAAFAKMSWGAIAKGLTGLAGSLIVLAIGVEAMSGTLLGAASLLIVAHALGMLIPTITALTKISWGDLLQSIAKLALVFGALAVATLLLTPIIPALLGLSAALTLVGVAMLAFGAGAALLGIGLTAIAASGGAAVAVLLSALGGLITMLPLLATSFATALVTFITLIGTNAPAIISAFVKLLTALLDAVPKIMPSLITALNSLIQTIITVLVTNAPKIIAAGFQLLMDLLQGIKNNIGQITKTVADIIVKFLNALASKLGDIIKAGVNLLFKFLEGVAAAAGKIPAEVIKLIGIFLGALFGSLPKIVSAGGRMIGSLLSGLGGALGKLASWAGSLVGKIVGWVGAKFGQLVSLGGTILGKIVSGIKNAVTGAASAVKDAAVSIGKSIINGIKDGIGSLIGGIKDKLVGGLKGAVGAVSDFLGIGGPSMMFSDMIGSHIPEGIAHGIDKNNGLVIDSVRSMGKGSILEMKKTMAGLGDVINSDAVNLSPTVKPVLDLSLLKKDASQIGGLVSTSPINAQLSANQAADISRFQIMQAALAAAESTVKSETPQEIKFEQNNYSPKAISTVDTYRNTRNQLSQAKQALGLVNS